MICSRIVNVSIIFPLTSFSLNIDPFIYDFHGHSAGKTALQLQPDPSGLQLPLFEHAGLSGGPTIFGTSVFVLLIITGFTFHQVVSVRLLPY